METNDISYLLGRLLAGPIIVFAIGYAWQRLSKKRKLTKKEFIILAIVALVVGLLLTLLARMNAVGSKL